MVPLDAAEIWALSDRLVSRTTFNPFLSQNVSDEKRERQIPGLRVLSPPDGALHPRISESSTI
jgi:hypothetical protein